MNDWYFTSDLHLGHESILNGIRGSYFSNIKEHDKEIINTLLKLPSGSNLMIAGDLFWKYKSSQAKDFFDDFNKRKINIHIVYGNHDKLSWFKHKIIKSQGYIKDLKINKQHIVICHYNMNVWNRSHYNSWLLFGHIHYNDNTWNKTKSLNKNDTSINGKKININIELNDFKPWSFEEIKNIMKIKNNNWDIIDKNI